MTRRSRDWGILGGGSEESGVMGFSRLGEWCLWDGVEVKRWDGYSVGVSGYCDSGVSVDGVIAFGGSVSALSFYFA